MNEWIKRKCKNEMNQRREEWDQNVLFLILLSQVNTGIFSFPSFLLSILLVVLWAPWNTCSRAENPSLLANLLSWKYVDKTLGSLLSSFFLVTYCQFQSMTDRLVTSTEARSQSVDNLLSEIDESIAASRHIMRFVDINYCIDVDADVGAWCWVVVVVDDGDVVVVSHLSYKSRVMARSSS